MKKYVLLLPLLLIPLLTSCDDDKVPLTYGTYIASSINSLKELSNEELLVKTRDEKETFLLAVYQGDYSYSCQCWTTFKNVVSNYINTYHECVYIYNAHSQDDSLANLKIEKLDYSTPYLYLFKGEKIIAKYSHANSKDKNMFEDTTGGAMKTKVHKVALKPSLYYVDEAFLNAEERKNEEIAVLYIRNGCSDCKYVLPNVIIPYIKDHALAKPIHLFDMQYYYDLKNKETASDEEKAKYQDLKDHFGLSEKGNATFGYQNGVVPTLQYIKKGEIVDATVYFNDEIAQKEDGSFYISKSYYSEERLKSVKYLKGCNFPTKLEGRTINEGVLQTENGAYYWAQNVADRYHKPILQAFLDYYLF